jgi:hypothetical protein
MTRKRVLNITTKKKHDTMLSWGNLATDSSDGSTTFHIGQQLLKGGRTYIIPWIATARDLTNYPSGNLSSAAQTAARTASLCYMRGLKERVQVQTSSGQAWQWRRICFRLKGPNIYTNQLDSSRLWTETSSGWMRTVNDWGNSTLAQNINIPLFQGTQGVDWSSYFTAKTSSDLVTVVYDKTRIISSGNANGVMRNYHHWFPMNANLQYAEDENGSGELEAAISTGGSKGMGDFYIVDYIAGGTGSTTSDILSFEPQATLYWHEK